MMNSKKSSAFNLTRYGIIVPAVVLLCAVFGTSKAAFIKKAKASVNSIASIAASPEAATSAESPANATKTQSAKAATDTGKVKAIKINFKPDPALYVINGKATTSSAIGKIDPKDIERIDVIKPPHSIKLFGKKGSNGVISVITKDAVNSPAVQQIQQKIKSLPKTAGTEATELVVLKDKDSTQQAKGSPAMFFTTGKSDTAKKWRIQVSPHNQGPKPLIVVDGVVKEDMDLQSVNPDDIKSVSVLKDASATATYGEKGKNGVVLIITKEGKKDN